MTIRARAGAALVRLGLRLMGAPVLPVPRSSPPSRMPYLDDEEEGYLPPGHPVVTIGPKAQQLLQTPVAMTVDALPEPPLEGSAAARYARARGG